MYLVFTYQSTQEPLDVITYYVCLFSFVGNNNKNKLYKMMGTEMELSLEFGYFVVLL